MILTLVLQQLPGPPPAQGFNELLWQQEALLAYNEMIAKGDRVLAAEWKQFYPSFHQQHPQLSVSQVLSVFVGEVAAGGIGSAVSQTGSLEGQIPGAAAKGAENAIAHLNNPLDLLKYPADFFYRLTQPGTWIRVAEFVVGGMLIYVGVRALVNPAPAVQGAKKAGGFTRKAITRVTPTGRAASVIVKHERRVRGQQTRQRAGVIRGKQREFGRRELYR